MNAYMQRLQELQGEKAQRTENRFSPYLNRPMATAQTGSQPSLPPEKPQEELPPEADMNTLFGQNFQEFANGDQRFQDMLKEYSELAMGLGEQVRGGLMPEAIAKQRLQSYLQDTTQYFEKNQPTLMDNPQMNQAITGLLAQSMQNQQGGQPDLEPAVDPAMMAQQEGGM